MEANPAYQGAMGITQTQTAHPLTFSPEVIQMLKQRMYDESATAFQGGLDAIGERMGAAGLYRSGSTNQQFQNAAGQYGRGIADASRQVDTQAALQRNQDYGSAIQNAMAMLGLQQRPYENIANAYSGAASNPAFGQPGPGAGIGEGLGSILSVLLAG